MVPADWSGRVGDVWAAQWRATDLSFAELEPHLEAAILAAAPAGPGRFLDIGCGAGTTLLAIAAARPDAMVIGADLSPALAAVAAGRAAAMAQVGVVAGDAVAIAAAHAPLAMLFSRHGVMFFDDPERALAGLAAAAAPGAPLVFSCFAAAADNPWAREAVRAIAPDAQADGGGPGPFAFADPVRVGALLAAAGWRADAPVRVDYRYRVGAGPDAIAAAVDFFSRLGPAASALATLAPEAAAAARVRLRDLCARDLVDGEVAFAAAAWLWTAWRL